MYIAAQFQSKLTLADMKTAFLMGKPQHRVVGGLFAYQPSGGIPGLLPERIIELLTKIYGRVDATLNRFTTLLEFFASIGLCQHPLEPCLLAYFESVETSPKNCGVVGVIVDDLIMCGNADFEEHV